ncbi:DinB family protein [Nocardioides sp.]|uniref:DinB family protein n=1 Tax=Nocardioides sp. TaxID=35761 RepID=UPI0026316157|nr:DinB family protein [Nocardioides sp.]
MAFDGMFVAPQDDPRGDSGAVGELATYRDYLDNFRLTLEMKCQDLSPEQLATRSVPPSDLSLLGLVRHMARVEHYWFSMVIDGDLGIERLDADDPTGGFHRVEPTRASVEEAFGRWRTWREYADGSLDRLDGVDLGDLRRDRHGADLSLREILVHLVEEYARHCGHADLLRECLDGRTGL